jgi:hypothetical protein
MDCKIVKIYFSTSIIILKTKQKLINSIKYTPTLKIPYNENDTKVKIFLVDDDALFLKSLEIEFFRQCRFFN